MNTFLSIGTWFSQNWMIIVLIVLTVALLVPTYLRQKKEANNRSELANSIKKGTKIVTTAGVYGVVESIENTTDGKVVTINTGTSDHPSTMTIHINAIMGIDNKTLVAEDEVVVKKVKDEKNKNDDENVDEITEKVQKKSTKKKQDKDEE